MPDDELTYEKIENRMRQAIRALDTNTKQWMVDLRELGHRKAKYKFASASSFVNHRISGTYQGVKITDKLADSLAAIDTDEFYQEYETAVANEAASKASVSSIRAELESLRSLMASYREHQ